MAKDCKNVLNKALEREDVPYLQINHEFNESLTVMYFVHGYRPY